MENLSWLFGYDLIKLRLIVIWLSCEPAIWNSFTTHQAMAH